MIIQKWRDSLFTVLTMRSATVPAVFLALVTCSVQQASGCHCKKVYIPVCGIDGITYQNTCELECAEVQLHYFGECGDLMNAQLTSQFGRCSCPVIYDPACGTDGNTYINVCYVACAGVELDHRGECKATQLNDLCKCPTVYRPVCGVDGVTYSNACFLMCEGVQLEKQGPCTPKSEQPITCFCPAVHDPACGVDGNTYNNACEAKCAGVQVDHMGQCNALICNDRCYCATEYQPVCGVNDITYENPCCMACADVDMKHQGAC